MGTPASLSARLLLIALLAQAAVASVRAAIPTTALYPFPGYDLEAVRAKTRAESAPYEPELAQAWGLYRTLRGSWMPGAAKPGEGDVARLDGLKRRLERLEAPPWFKKALESPGSGQAQLAERIGDAAFEAQRATPEYQRLKALALVYLTEHELDRTDAARKAGLYLMALGVTHPWDWEVSGLYSRLLIDARMTAQGWDTARVSLFLNPDPALEDLKFFAFVGSIAAKEQWAQIQEAMRQAANDRRVAELAIVESERFFSAQTKVNLVEPKTR